MKELIPNNFFGLKYNSFNISEFYDFICNTIKLNNKKIIYGYSLLLLPKLKDNPEIYDYANSFDFFVIDGRGLYSLMKLFKVSDIIDISLPDAVEHILKIADLNRFKVFIFGASKEINEQAKINIHTNYPNIKLIYGIDGYRYKNNENNVIDEINNISPDILLIGISSPEKERIAFEWKDKLNCNIIVPCGGVIDILGGKTKREPIIIKKLNLTWFYRFLQEPKRLFKALFMNGIKIIFTLLPSIFYNVRIKKNLNYSIPCFYRVKKTKELKVKIKI